MRIIEINDLSLQELQIFHALNEAQLLHYSEPNEGIFIAESRRVIERALDAGFEPISMLIEHSRLSAAAELTERAGEIPVYSCGEALRGITGYNLTEGFLCAFRRKRLCPPAELCRGKRRIAVLENVVNPTNIGAIFRSAAAMGIEAVLLTPACCDPLYRRAIRVSMGNVFSVGWTYVTDTQAQWEERGIEILHELGFCSAALALRDDTIGIRDERLRSEARLAILLGAEGEGLADKTISDADYAVKIPMTNGVDSLNVAAASAVAFWELAMK
ncbi:MAG: TrmH family RNA methyltransferase [Oscillospiraceae bacterium]